MSGITNRVLRPVPDAEARKPIRGRHNLRYAIEKPWVETRGFSIAGGWVAGWVRCRGIGGFLLPWQDKSYVPLSAKDWMLLVATCGFFYDPDDQLMDQIIASAEEQAG